MMKLKAFFILLLGVILINSCNSSEYPKELSGKVEVIEVDYINWACDCADFVETTYYRNPDYEVTDKDCIFITPSNSDLVIPESYYIKDHFDYYLKLKGQYYFDKGVPDSYEQKTEEKPQKARVFRYDRFELVRK